MKYRFLWIFSLLLATIVLVLTIWIDYTHLIEAYGSGPPYYGRSTNMDKWENPAFFLIVFNSASIVLTFAILRFGFLIKRKE